MERYAIVLAAGKGTRMKSRDPSHSKVAYPILGKPLVNYVLDAIKPLSLNTIVVVVGFGGEVTKKLVEKDAEVVWQHEILGTGHAVKQASSILENKKGSTLIVCGDTPLITTETLENVFKVHERTNNKLTCVSAVLENPKGYGRIVREKPSNRIIAIKEDKDCSDSEREITEVNTGIYVMDNELLFTYLSNLKNNNSQQEYYLTDLVEMFVNSKQKVGTYVVEDATEMFGVNDRVQLAYAAKIIRKRINHTLMLTGVSIEDPDTTYICPNVKIDRDTIILPNTTILGDTVIGEANVIGPNVVINNSLIKDDNHIYSAYLDNVEVGSNNEIGPFVKLDKGTIIKNKELIK